VLRILARGIAASCALAALAAAGPALGGDPVSKQFSANLKLDGTPGGTIEFVLDDGEKRKVHSISITAIVANCEDNRGELNFDIYGHTKVLDDRSFAVRSADIDNPKAKAVVRGQFSRKFKRAKGSARLYGKFNLGGGGLTDCESRKQKFKATVSG
jgi:hypothetical protein